MNAALVPSIVISLFLIFVTLGFICGWFRGMNKSLVRLIIVLCIGVISFFTIPPLTKSLLEMDISKLNIVLGDVHVMTLQDLATDLLRQIPVVEDIIESSSTFETFIEILPQLILNVVLFVLFFFILKWFSMIIYWIIAGIFFSKKKMAGKEKHNFIGAVIGAVQGLIVVFVLLVPFYGVIETIKPVASSIQEEQTVNNENKAFNSDIYYVTTENEEPETMNNSLTQIMDSIDNYTDEFDSVWVNKVLNFFGIKKLGVSMFNKLTTVETSGVEFSVMEEVKVIANAYPYAKPIINDGLDVQDNEKLEGLKTAIDKLYKSKLLSNMVKEIVPEIAHRWSNGQAFCEVSKPKLEDEAMNVLFDALLLNLSVAEGDSVKNDIDVTVDLLMIANDAQIIKTMSEEGDIMELLRKPENANLISDIISKALESSTLKAVLPDVLNVGMNFVYDALDIDKDTIDDIDIDSNDVDWDSEKTKLQTIFTNVVEMLNQIEMGEENNQTALESLDFKLLGTTFDSIRFSELLGPSSIHIMEALMNSPEIIGENSETLQPFVTKLKTAWSGTEPLAPTFESLGKALKLAKDMQTNAEDFKVDDLGEVLGKLATDETLKEVVTEVIKTDTLKELGLDETTAGVVNETISGVLDLEGEELQTEIKAVEEVFVVANKVLNSDNSQTSEEPMIDVNAAEGLVEALAGSTTILDAITKEDSAVKDLNISEKLDEDSKNNLSAQINALNTETEVLQGKSAEEIKELKNKLNSLFGITNNSEEE